MNVLLSASSRRTVVFLLAVAGLLLPGCANVYEDMYTDEQALRAPVQTASSRRVYEINPVRTERKSSRSPKSALAEDARVAHGALYFEDPFEWAGSEDATFAWTWEDYFAIAYGDGRWLVNSMFIWASLGVHPIGSVAETDGARVGPSVALGCCAPSTGRLPASDSEASSRSPKGLNKPESAPAAAPEAEHPSSTP